MTENLIASRRSRVLCVLDAAVASTILLVIVASIGSTFIKEHEAVKPWLEHHRFPLNVAAAAECGLLLFWMGVGGQRSQLWSWLPPFCFFPKIMWLRWVIVIALNGGTLAGIASE